jgi:uncharacterized membrane protein
MKYRLIITAPLALIGIGLMAYYASCDTACSYLKGNLLGVDLKYIGIVYMVAIILLALLRQADLLRLLISAGIGVEIFLVSFQVRENVFCPFCLSFGALVVIMYLINYERLTFMKKWYLKFIYAFGDAKIPFLDNYRFPLSGMMLIGYTFVCLTFTGAATPAYAASEPPVPSFGKGAWELIIFTDYFCPPCQLVEKDLEPEIERLLSRGDIKIIFVDYPGHQHTSLYAKYFLSSIAADKGNKHIIKTRNVLFSLAVKNMDNEAAISSSLKSEGIALKTIDPKPVFNEWMSMIKRYEINQTPTCLLRFSSTYTKKYIGTDQIRSGLIPELRKRFPN